MIYRMCWVGLHLAHEYGDSFNYLQSMFRMMDFCSTHAIYNHYYHCYCYYHYWCWCNCCCYYYHNLKNITITIIVIIIIIIIVIIVIVIMTIIHYHYYCYHHLWLKADMWLETRLLVQQFVQANSKEKSKSALLILLYGECIGDISHERPVMRKAFQI